MATNLALQLQVIEPDTDLNSIMIGNSNYNDDVWDLRPFITAKSTKESQKYIRFEYIADVDMKETVKQYAYYKLGKMKPQTVRDYINAKLPMFIEYCSLNGIHSFADVTLEDYLNFNLWMKNDKKVETTDRIYVLPYSRRNHPYRSDKGLGCTYISSSEGRNSKSALEY